METKKNNQKKGVFEPVSAEEAKKIRAYENGNGGSWESGIECASGGDAVELCFGKYPGAPCCYLYNGKEVYGKCVYFNGTTALDLICVSDFNK